MVMMGGDCGCWTSLAIALGASMLPDGDRSGVAGSGGENADTRFCLWCGEPNVEPELAEEARFSQRVPG
jgi:hypothetical protein